MDFLDTLPDSSLSGLDVLEFVSESYYAMLPDHASDYRVVVIDIDGGMLEEPPVQRIEGQQERRSYVKAEAMSAAMRYHATRFKAVCILSGSIASLTPGERLRVMRRAAGCLPLGGVFIASVEYVLPQAPPTHIVRLHSDAELIDETDHRNRTWRRILRRGSQEWISEFHLVTPEDLAHDIRTTGMTVVKQQSTPDPDHPFLIRVVLGAINPAVS
ncbi:hypothetical protein MANAM107_11840 [Actinomyces capricornis]|uniref:Class I SAM-dependent methyltransferase n=2 Tax=Actinomyces capricornis TaxID=2755559 RepID=A0ABN6K8H7_9ACTO|nr:hypothetical protein MANAM107_11840 [Actinomyces capricornis]